MILSADRQNYFIHLIINKLQSEGWISYEDKDQALAVIRQVLNQCIKECGDMDEKIRAKISSLKRKVQENDSQWQVLYFQYLEDEMVRRGISSLKEEPAR